MKKTVMLLLVSTVFTVCGCAPQPMYNWGNYSNTLYHFRKDANDDTRDKHMAELESIIKGSNEHAQRVPPGVYCELGYMHAKKGDKSQAFELFALEKTTYPESTHFVDRLVESIKNIDDASKKSAQNEPKKIGS
jgi:hypothetical protein